MLSLEIVKVLGQLSVDVVRKNADRREQGSQDRQLLLKQLNFLLKAFIFSCQYFDPVLCLSCSHLCLLSGFPHRNIVPFSASPVLIRTLLIWTLVLLARAHSILWLLGE